MGHLKEPQEHNIINQLYFNKINFKKHKRATGRKEGSPHLSIFIPKTRGSIFPLKILFQICFGVHREGRALYSQVNFKRLLHLKRIEIYILGARREGSVFIQKNQGVCDNEDAMMGREIILHQQRNILTIPLLLETFKSEACNKKFYWSWKDQLCHCTHPVVMEIHTIIAAYRLGCKYAFATVGYCIVSQGCCNKVPQTQRLKTTEICPLTVL